MLLSNVLLLFKPKIKNLKLKIQNSQLKNMLYKIHFLGALLAWFILLFCPLLSYGQEEEAIENIDYYNPNVLEYSDKVYQENIKTVLFHIEDDPLSNPVIPLNGNFQLQLTFDDLEGENSNYTYQIIHCNADWQPSNLSPFEYIDGFTEEAINNYSYSANTLQDYTQYIAIIPNSFTKITKSGNYILKVYEDGNEDALVLTRRFMVFENKLGIDANLLTANNNRYFRTHQRLQFSIFYSGFSLVNPLSDLKVHILQNGRWDNAITDIQPVFFRDKTLIYNHLDRTLFEGGNEFRYFDLTSLDYLKERVEAADTIEESHHVFLVEDVARNKTQFARFQYNYNDFNGKYSIGIYRSTFRNLDADYAYVHFFLPLEKPLTTGNIYIFGAVSDWRINPDFQMRYNHKKKQYEGQVYLKQGYYDYQYVIVNDGKSAIDYTSLEGSYFSTENDYQLLVYYTPFGARYDRLVGFQSINSLR